MSGYFFINFFEKTLDKLNDLCYIKNKGEILILQRGGFMLANLKPGSIFINSGYIAFGSPIDDVKDVQMMSANNGEYAVDVYFVDMEAFHIAIRHNGDYEVCDTKEFDVETDSFGFGIFDKWYFESKHFGNNSVDSAWIKYIVNKAYNDDLIEVKNDDFQKKEDCELIKGIVSLLKFPTYNIRKPSTIEKLFYRDDQSINLYKKLQPLSDQINTLTNTISDMIYEYLYIQPPVILVDNSCAIIHSEGRVTVSLDKNSNIVEIHYDHNSVG